MYPALFLLVAIATAWAIHALRRRVYTPPANQEGRRWNIAAIVSGICGCTVYRYRIIAFHEDGHNEMSPTACVTTGPHRLSDENYITLHWKPHTGVRQYSVHRTGPFGECVAILGVMEGVNHMIAIDVGQRHAEDVSVQR